MKQGLTREDLLRHEHLALFIHGLSPSYFQPLATIKGCIKSQQPIVENELTLDWQLSPIAILIARLLSTDYFYDRIKSIWFFDKNGVLGKLTQNKKPNFSGLSENASNSSSIATIQQQLSKYPSIAPPTLRSVQGASDVSALGHLFLEYEVDDAMLVAASSPFIDLALAKKMHGNHVNYLTEFSFSENVPNGFAAEFVHRSIIHRFDDHFSSQDLPSQYSLGQAIRKNINNFDIEVNFEQPDIRWYRCHGNLTDPMQTAISTAIIAKRQQIPSYQQFAQAIMADPLLARVHPTYIEIELITECALNCVYCPRHYHTISRQPMTNELFRHILDECSLLVNPVTIALGGMGEPLQHEHFLEFIEQAYQRDYIQQIIIETNALLLNEATCDKLFAKKDKIHIIVNFCSLDKEIYQKLQTGEKENFHEQALTNIGYLASLPGNKSDFATIEFLKIKQTQKDIDSFYKHWQDRGLNSLLQKQNCFNGLIPDFRFSDLTPHRRMPCWHLQRDMLIQSDGNVVVCKQDITNKCLLGNFKRNSLLEIWQKNAHLVTQMAKGEFPQIPDCRQCDEWYTFNL